MNTITPPLARFQEAIQKEGTRKYLIKIALLMITYVVTAKLGLELAFNVPQATTIWPPTGIAIAATLLWGYHYAPGIFVGALLANVLSGTPALVATGIALGNTLEAVIAVFLIHRFISHSQILEKISGFMGFVFLVAFLSTTVSATIGVSSLLLGGQLSLAQFNSTWFVWWVGDMLGALIIVPFVMAWRKRSNRDFINDNLFEALLVFMIVATAGFIIFSQPTQSLPVASLLIYLTFPLLMWAAVRLTQIGAVTATTIIAVAAIWGTLAQRGPYTLGTSVEENLIFLHVFLFVIIVTAVVLAVAVSGRLRSEEALHQKARELEEAKQLMLHNVKWRKDLEGQVKDATEKINNILGSVFEDRSKGPKL